MEFSIKNVGQGFVVISLEEYLRLKEIEKYADELRREKIQRILKGE